jgi:hypothetical protein
MSLFVLHLYFRRKRRGIKPALRNKFYRTGIMLSEKTEKGGILTEREETTIFLGRSILPLGTSNIHSFRHFYPSIFSGTPA